MNKNYRIGLVAAIAGLSLAACGGGADTVSNSGATATPSSVAGPVGPNSAPVITGTPGTTTTAGKTYLAQFIASDADGDALVYSATGLPAWASINPQTGQLYGTPSELDAGITADIVVRVSDGRITTSFAAFHITIASAMGPVIPGSGGSGSNSAPTISGTPLLSVASGASYSFTPTASDPDGNMLSFSISGKPGWAAFSIATGTLTGVAEAGTYANIVISVSDGTVTRALPAFTLSVNAANSGTASLNWSAPAQNTDGSTLTDLAGYRIYHGTSASSLSDVIQVADVNSTSYTFSQLASGTHYFAVAAYNSAGIESAFSAVGSKTIL